MEQIHKELNIEYLKEFTTKLSKSFYQRCEVSEYELIKGLGQYDYAPLIKHARPKYFLLK